MYKEKRELKLFSSQVMHSIGCSEKKEEKKPTLGFEETLTEKFTPLLHSGIFRQGMPTRIFYVLCCLLVNKV